MTRFPAPPKIAYYGELNGSRIYALTEDYYFKNGCVRKGFLTDGVSVCRILWPWFHPLGALFPAAVKHDQRYYEQSGTRKQADLEMLADMTELGVGRIKRQLAYRVLRAVGWRAWRENQTRPMENFWTAEAIEEQLNPNFKTNEHL